MGQIAKICIQILVALTLFLTGWIAGNWNKKKAITDATKKAICDVQKTQKEALMRVKGEYEDKLRKKDEIINRLKDIIERLLRELNKKDASGYAASLTPPGLKLTRTLKDQLNKLNTLTYKVQ